MRRRLGRERTFVRSMVLAIGVITIIALIAKRRVRDDQQTRVPEEAGEAPARSTQDDERSTGENIQAHADKLPVEDYDSLNVHQVTQKLG
ncbi:MAG: hypothetical protein JOZ19_07565, partial [Rubrobacter sp.]|nr:hypothetical protein [Rubrobacter sp.]